MSTPQERIYDEIVLTAEIIGDQHISGRAVERMAEVLAARYTERQVTEALSRVQQTTRGRLSLAAIIDCIDDGHPGPEQAWALCPRSEGESAVWTDEVSQAYFEAAVPLLDTGDAIAARKAFLERYSTLLARARHDARPPRWRISLGSDPGGRERVVRQAMERQLLGREQALALVPALADHPEPDAPPALAHQAAEMIRVGVSRSRPDRVHCER